MMPHDDSKTHAVIYGSCVSRDTFEFLDPGAFHLDRYIARQSLISAYAEPTILESSDIESLTSEFQKRTVRDDFRGSLHEDMQTFGTGADLLIWDLTDERYGVWDLGGGQFVTRSVELISSGIDSRLKARATLVPFGSSRHFSMWNDALQKFYATLASAGLVDKTVLLAPRWATKDENGSAVRSALGPGSRYANKILSKYSRCVSSTKPVTTGRLETRANSLHKWGAAPYHYSDHIYSRLSQEIVSMADRPRP